MELLCRLQPFIESVADVVGVQNEWFATEASCTPRGSAQDALRRVVGEMQEHTARLQCTFKLIAFAYFGSCEHFHFKPQPVFSHHFALPARASEIGCQEEMLAELARSQDNFWDQTVKAVHEIHKEVGRRRRRLHVGRRRIISRRRDGRKTRKTPCCVGGVGV